jgi:predicted nucleic acid-binding protein
MSSPQVCVDASLSLKLVLAEPDRALARQLWDDWITAGIDIVTVPLWGYEVTSVIRNKVFRGILTPGEGEKAFETVHKLGVRLVVPEGLHRQAWEVAADLNLPTVYDAYYLVLAEILACPFWTADRRLYNAIRPQVSWIHWLGHQ